MPTSYPTNYLQPGQSSDAVKQLQQWLISQGYSIPAGATGYYGDQTKAAVAKLQSDKGIDTAGNPGFWGPRTISGLTATTSVTKPAQSEIDAAKAAQAKAQKEFDDNQAAGKDIKGNATGGLPAPSSKETTNFDEPVTGVAFKDSGAYKALSPDLQKLVDLGYNVYLKGGEAEATTFADSLTKAQALADPYAKAQLGLFHATFVTQIAKENSDYKFSSETLQKTRDELAADLKTNKDFLSLQEQADMATALRGYDEDLLTIGDQAAEKGITFATGARSRTLAEERRGAQYQDVVQSSQREFNFKVNELQTQAARGDADAKAKLDKLNADKGFDLQQIGQNAEKVLGSTGAADLKLEGFTPSGGNLGTIEQDRRKSIIDLASLAIPK